MSENDTPKRIHLKGRAANSNANSRFDYHERSEIDDGWGSTELERPAPIRTNLVQENAKSIINYVNSPDLPFDRTINTYRGCEHGCVYCYARPTHAYLGYSPGLDFETQLLMKSNAVDLLKKELANPKYQCKPIALGMNTDAYQPIDKTHQLTRQIIQTLSEANHPFTLVTKSSMVERDIDLIAPMAKKGLASIYLSITSLDNQLSRLMEPRAAAPQRRLQTLKTLTDAGIPTGVMVAPMIPALNDHHLEKILTLAAKAGAKQASYVLIRLPLELTDLFEDWLTLNYPLKAKHVMSIIKQTRGGKTYQFAFGERMRGNGIFADLLSNRFKRCCRQLNLQQERLNFNTSDFKVPDDWLDKPPHRQYDLF